MNKNKLVLVVVVIAAIQPWYGPMSQWLPNAAYTTPFCSSSPGRWW